MVGAITDIVYLFDSGYRHNAGDNFSAERNYPPCKSARFKENEMEPTVNISLSDLGLLIILAQNEVNACAKSHDNGEECVTVKSWNDAAARIDRAVGTAIAFYQVVGDVVIGND
jgi:hypothetical protein